MIDIDMELKLRQNTFKHAYCTMIYARPYTFGFNKVFVNDKLSEYDTIPIPDNRP